jgi:O-succinylbenzoate synthase
MQVQLPFIEPVRTATGVHLTRPLVMVHLTGAVGGAPVDGWGECAALADTAYDAEDATAARATLEEALIPALFDEAAALGGSAPPPSGLERIRGAVPRSPMAFAALEMAVADLHLRAEGRSLASALGVGGRPVELGAVLGQFETVGALAAAASVLFDAGFTRLKLKIGPGWDVAPIKAVRRAAPDLRLQADANGSYSESDAVHLAELDRFGLLCLEQPLARDDLEGHVRLAARMATSICLDESLDSPESTRRAIGLGACSVVCVKPARLGGIGRALELVEWCHAHAVPLWMGGMFESGYARRVNTTVAGLPGFAWPGDLSPARWYLADDLVGEPELVRSGPDRSLAALPAPGPGMGPPPSAEALRRYRAPA